MGYLNGKVGYRNDILETRSIVKKDNYVVLDPDGLVKNVVPGFENCDVTILATPKMGASYVDYLVTLKENGGNKSGFGEEGVETFLYVLSGKLNVKAEDKEFELTEGGYLFVPEGEKVYFENAQSEDSMMYLYKRVYERIDGYEAYLFEGNVNDFEYEPYEGMENVGIKDLLPADLGFDMNFHILSFQPGASHGYLETHIQEHGAYVLSGRGMYNLDNEWMPIRKGDYLFMSAYSIQGAYGVGEEPFAYLYSKDCNRDFKLR